jgi:hypothetical protein
MRETRREGYRVEEVKIKGNNNIPSKILGVLGEMTLRLNARKELYVSLWRHGKD